MWTMESNLVLSVAVVSGFLLSASIVLLLFRRLQGPKQAAEGKAELVAEDTRPVVRICFGTQTGTAEKFSKQLAAALAAHAGEAARIEVLDMEQYDHEQLIGTELALVFIVATYGDGEPTDNSVKMYNWLLKASEDVMNGERGDVCKGQHYAVFGLGNKQYEHFNAVAKAMHKHMEVVGGVPILPVGLGDDDADIADDFEVWSEAFLAALAETKLVVKSRQSTSHGPLVGYTATTHPQHANGSRPALACQHSATWAGHAVTQARITAVRELHSAASERSCVHVEVDISGTGLSYEHGDHMAVFPQNSAETVEAAAALLGEDLEAVLELAIPPGNPEMLSEPFPCPTTLRAALTHHTCLLRHPDKRALEALAECATSQAEAARLRRLASHEGKAEFARYVVDDQRSLLQILADFPSARPPLGLFFGHIAARLQPRYYSISSSPLQHPQQVHLTVAVVDEVGPTGRRHRGVASHWLANCQAGQVLPCFVRRSTFKLPKEVATPIVMVGPGTGLAPFRGFLQHRAALRKCGDQLGPGVLYFGCRHPDKDYIYHEELESHHQSKSITELHVAFSRMTSDKDYVQHHMIKHGQALHKALQDGAVLYVCGDAKHMAKDVHRALHDVVMQWGAMSSSQAELFVKNMQMSGRYLQDVW